nr:glutamyl-tRNA reductase-binding protein, chloroplastic [Ipomoea batatas]
MKVHLGAPSTLRCCFYPFSGFHNNHINYLRNYNYAPLNYLPPSRPFFPLVSPAPPPPRLPPLAMAASTNIPTQSVSDAGDGVNVFQLIQVHQEKAARLPPIEEVRTVLGYSLRGVLSTFSQVVLFGCNSYAFSQLYDSLLMQFREKKKSMMT